MGLLLLGVLSLDPTGIVAGDLSLPEQAPGMVTRMLSACRDQELNDRVRLPLESGKTVEARCRMYGGELLAVPEQLLDRLQQEDLPHAQRHPPAGLNTP